LAVGKDNFNNSINSEMVVTNMKTIEQAKFNVGQIIHHKLFNYRGVIFDVDPAFQGSDEWYDTVAKSHPPKDQPWYHVLVHNGGYNTYVAERNLEEDWSSDDIENPLVEAFFSKFENGVYISNRPNN
jgi:heat shock protein HspQ